MVISACGFTAAAPESRRRRHAVPEVPDRRGRTSRRAATSRASISISICPTICCRNFPAPIFLTTRPDLGDVSKGKLVTSTTTTSCSTACLNPEADRRTAAARHAFPAAAVQPDRRSPLGTAEPRRGLLRLPCQRPHQCGDASGGRHPSAAEHRHRIDTPTLARREHPAAVRLAARTQDDRGFHRVRTARRLLRRRPGDRDQEGRERARTRQPGAFHGGVRGLLDFPPAPKLDVLGRLDPRRRRSEAELRGQEIFFGKGKCSICHVPPYYTDNLMHNLQVERFFKQVMINGRLGQRRWPDQDLPAARHQGLAALSA